MIKKFVMSQGETTDAGEPGQPVQNSALRLYEVVNEDGASVSPFVWRTRFALAKKKLAYESVAVGYLDIPNIGSGTLKNVPILQSNDTFIVDSWPIAEWLDRRYPDHPAIFQSQSDIAMIRFFDKWFSTAVSSPMRRACIGALHDTLRLEDRGYFKTSIGLLEEDDPMLSWLRRGQRLLGSATFPRRANDQHYLG
jgi:hypothetical protein